MQIELVEMILRPEVVADVLCLLESFNIDLASVSYVEGVGRQRGHTEIFRGREYRIATRPKVRIEVFVDSVEQRENLIRQLRDTVYTGHVGDGKIFVIPVEAYKTIGPLSEQGNTA